VDFICTIEFWSLYLIHAQLFSLIWFQLAIKVKNIQGGGYDFNMFGKQVNIVQDT
jgi:hypothetical protein